MDSNKSRSTTRRIVKTEGDELRREPDQWFWALESITEENPVPPEAKGNVRQMA
jgi:hypothetical protein